MEENRTLLRRTVQQSDTSTMPTMRRIRRRLHTTLSPLIVAGMLAAIWTACEDPLPPYESPADIFSGEFYRFEYDTCKFREPRDGSDAKVATYETYPAYFKIHNTYEEAIQLKVSLTGSLEMWMPFDRTLKSTVPLTSSNIQPMGGYNPATGDLTLDPGSYIVIKANINPKLAGPFYIHKYATVDHLQDGGPGMLLYFYRPLTVAVRLTVQLRPDLPTVTSEETVPLVLFGRVPMSTR